ncbi:MAG TPA: hypothetical protein VN634_04195 [Candidatus Limnocylindrales bacterium]|nr:hypothetical protein [Candidatus Limnocylindrales bacterium]
MPVAPNPRVPNNVVAEWFGRRVYPTVAATPEALSDQQNRRCPFLSAAIESTCACVKAPRSAGVCTISSTSNGTRQDWLVCPYRALDPNLVENAVRRLFDISPEMRVMIRPATTLARREVRAELLDALARGEAVFVYMQDKLGGEVSLIASPGSPELSFDVTLVNLVPGPMAPTVGQYAILEVQTMDFHGSYSHVVKDLDDALRLHAEAFHQNVRANVGWLCKKIEGPNIANVFKRTLYQMLLKFRLAGNGACAGAALAIPQAVWDSWQRHLGAPVLVPVDDGTFRLVHPTSPVEPRAWLYIFDLDTSGDTSPDPVVVTKVIGTDADTMTHYAFKAAPEAILAAGGPGSMVLDVIRARLANWWPELGPLRRAQRLSPKTSLSE